MVAVVPSKLYELVMVEELLEMDNNMRMES